MATARNIFGQSFDGSAALTGAATANAFIPDSATVPTNGMYLSADNTLSFATNSTLKASINSSGGLGIGVTAAANNMIYVGGTYAVSGVNQMVVYTAGTIASGITGVSRIFSTAPITEAASFTLGGLHHFYASQQAFGAGSTVTNQYGYIAEVNLIGATNNCGYCGGIPAGAGRYNLYMSGTAANYLAGATQVANTLTANAFIPDSATVPTNGMYQRTTNTLDFATNSVRVLEIGAVGTIGLGVSADADTSFYSSKTHSAGGATKYGLYFEETLASTVTSAYYGCTIASKTAAAAFTLVSFYAYIANTASIGAGSSVTNQSGFTVSSSFTAAATNNYGFVGYMAAATGRYNIYISGTAQNYIAGDMQFAKTVTAAGTTGAQTINKTTGSVNFAAAAASLVVTNSLVATTSIIICTIGTNDTTMKSVAAVAAAGSFTLYANAAATAETRVNFLVTN